MDYKEEEENILDCRLANVIKLQRQRIAKNRAAKVVLKWDEPCNF